MEVTEETLDRVEELLDQLEEARNALDDVFTGNVDDLNRVLGCIRRAAAELVQTLPEADSATDR